MILSIINNKGGTGKTTTSINLSSCFAQMGYKTLLMDLDPQAYASLSSGIPFSELRPSIYDCFTGDVNINDTIRKTENNNLQIITSELALSELELFPQDISNKEELLSNSLSQINELYDFIIIDCPPSYNLLCLNSIVASDYLIVPVTPEYLSLEGLVTFYDNICDLAESWQLDTELLGILITLADGKKYPKKNRIMQKQIIDLIKDRFKNDVFNIVIHRDINISLASSHNKSIFSYAPASKSSAEYRKLADEIIGLTVKNINNEIKEAAYGQQIK